jgi:hypothetical protein
MRLLLVVALLCTSSLVWAEEKVDVTCYLASDDRDGDGFARDGAASQVVSVPESTKLNCPAGYVKLADDCDDTRSAVHPNRAEIAFNTRDDNCNDESDENEFVYFHEGFDNLDTSYKMRVKLNNRDVLDRYNAGSEIYAKVTYRKITQDATSDQESGYKRVYFYDYTHTRLGEYTGTNVTLTGLALTTVYRSRVQFFYKSGVNYFSIGIKGPSVYYTTTTEVANAVSQARTGILLEAFRDYFYQRLGLLGKGGTVWPNGTRYGADLHEAWCTEFYSYASRLFLKDIHPTTNTAKMQTYFGSNFSRVYDIGDLGVARRADWLAIDWDGNGSKDHTAMFLGKHVDGSIVTIEGNTGNTVGIKYRDVSLIYGLGHITTSKVN